MAKERAELYNTSCYIQPDDDDNQLILTRKRPYDGEIGFATATLTCRLGIWKCIIRAGNNVIDIFDGKFHLDVYTNMCVVLEVIGERNKWKCCHGYSHSQDQKIEFAYECLGVFKGKEDTNSSTFNVCNKCKYAARQINKDTPQSSHKNTPYTKRPQTEVVQVVRQLNKELHACR